MKGYLLLSYFYGKYVVGAFTLYVDLTHFRLVGDTCNMLGAVLTHQTPVQKIIGVYYIIQDLTLWAQYGYYTKLYPKLGIQRGWFVFMTLYGVVSSLISTSYIFDQLSGPSFGRLQELILAICPLSFLDLITLVCQMWRTYSVVYKVIAGPGLRCSRASLKMKPLLNSEQSCEALFEAI